MKSLLVALAILFAASAHAAEPCQAKELKFTIGGRNGDFTGMSHDGAWIILQNIGTRTCTVPKRPTLTMLDKAGKPVAAKLDVPPGMHPGPVLVPLLLKPNEIARGKMQWVMGEVYDNSICADVETAAFNAPGGTLSSPIRARMCGQKSDGIFYEQEWMQPASARRKR